MTPALLTLKCRPDEAVDEYLRIPNYVHKNMTMFINNAVKRNISFMALNRMSGEINLFQTVRNEVTRTVRDKYYYMVFEDKYRTIII